MKKTILKTFIIIIEIATLIFAMQTLSISTIFDNFLYGSQNASYKIDETYLTDRTSNLNKLNLSDTISSSNNIVYVHSNDFGVTIDMPDTYTTKESYSYDNNKRLENIKVELDKTNVSDYHLSSNDYTSSFNQYQLTKTGVKFTLTGYTWKNAVQPIMNKLSTWITSNNEPVLLNVQFKYTDNEKYARYLQIKAISKSDDGVAVNINYDIYNTDDAKQPNWETGTFYSLSSDNDAITPAPQLETRPYANTYATPADVI